MSGITPTDFSFIVPCTGRPAHLQQTLPLLLALTPATAIVVDYSSPDASGDRVEAHCPAARVVRMQGAPTFNPGAARNAGAAAATSAWRCFIDADVEPGEDFAAQVGRLADAPAFYTVTPVTRGLSGTVYLPAHRRGAHWRL